jgi:hypothetical protein
VRFHYWHGLGHGRWYGYGCGYCMGMGVIWIWIRAIIWARGGWAQDTIHQEDEGRMNHVQSVGVSK